MTDGVKLSLGRGAAPTLLHVSLPQCSLARACLQGASEALPSIHRLHFPQARPFSCKHALVFLRRRKSPSKSSGLSGCSFISSFLFTAEVPERAVCSHHRSTQCLSGMSGRLPPPWEPRTAASPPVLFCAHPVLGTAGLPATPSGAGALPPCGAVPSLHCHPTPFPSMFDQVLHPDI